MTELSKRNLRTTLRQRRRSLSTEAQAAAQKKVTQLALTLPEWLGAERIAIYHNTDGEIGTDSIIQYCHNSGIQVYLPVLRQAKKMAFARLHPNDELLRNNFGILEPPASAPLCPPAQLDIVFLPLVAWDKSCGRLGMGAGYYDRALAGINGPLLAGLAHQMQEVERVPLDPWDVALDIIITEVAIYHR